MSAFRFRRFRGISLSNRRRPVRLDQTQARKIGEGPLLIIEGDGFGAMCSEQNLFGPINAHVMDSRAERMVTCFDGQKETRIGLDELFGIVVRGLFSSIRCVTVHVNANKRRVAFDKARSCT